MIIERMTLPVKRGHEEETIKLSSAVRDYYAKRNVPMHIYTPLMGQFGVLVLEWVYESLAHFEKDNEEVFATPEANELASKYLEHLEHGGSREIWEVH